MRSGFPLLTAALLAGCGAQEDANRTAPEAQAPPVAAAPAVPSRPAPAPPAPAQPAAPAAAAGAIPSAFLGVYDGSREACGRPSDARLTVAPRELRFHESIGTVRGVTATGADSVRVEADYQGEGESWRSVRDLRLSDGGATLTISGDGTRLDRVRCPAGAR